MMIKRIVKLTFQQDLVPDFMEVFEGSKHAIRAFEGCRSMELLGDLAQPNILFTFSVWESEEALERYRLSPLFQDTWAKTKILFSDKAQAWSVQVLDSNQPT